MLVVNISPCSRTRHPASSHALNDCTDSRRVSRRGRPEVGALFLWYRIPYFIAGIAGDGLQPRTGRRQVFRRAAGE